MKILAAASIGGHWKELLCILPVSIENITKVYVSTNQKCEQMVSNNRFYVVSDFNRWNAYKIFMTLFQSIKILYKERPNAVITTGAAPGLILLITARCFNIKSFWIDSAANVDTLSMSGKIASRFATRTYTQWQRLANKNIIFVGNIFE